jgi:imidazole glycerol-phosphate synthase subunit HisH
MSREIRCWMRASRAGDFWEAPGRIIGHPFFRAPLSNEGIIAILWGMKIAIVDYGMANLRSVQKAFEAIGVDSAIVDSAEGINKADAVVLPGVGAVADAIRTIHEKGFAQAILDHIKKDKPFLGICLGLQMLFETCHEEGVHKGLGVIQGEVVRFDVDAAYGLKVPHMGWNQLQFVSDNPLYKGLPQGSNVYFVHSYHGVPADKAVAATLTDYGRPFVSSIRRGNLFATQFHPEKSQKVGLQILRNFADLG